MSLGRFRASFWQEWSQFWTMDCNWYDMHILWFHWEVAPYKDSIEINVGVLGFCVSCDWFYGQKAAHPAPPKEGQ